MSFLFFQDNTAEQTLCADYHQETRIVILDHPADGDRKVLRNGDNPLLMVMTSYTRRIKLSL